MRRVGQSVLGIVDGHRSNVSGRGRVAVWVAGGDPGVLLHRTS
ncbi:hypothetical protein NY08_2302 [Rhodococcus sp. B7740]|nr:hypothetical protein NY08_2302 [Rhodococcus sp. B7740]